MKPALACLALALTVFGLGLSFFFLLPERYPELANYERLWRAEENLPRSLPELEELAEREDGVGWQARVLASRAFLTQADYEAGARYLTAALKLRATVKLRAELALTLEAAGNRTEALRAWEKLLPASDAVQAIIRLEANPERAARLGTYRSPSDPATLPDAPMVFPSAVRVADALLATLPGKGAANAAEAEMEIALDRADAAERLAIGQWYLQHRYYRSAYRIGVESIANKATRTAYELAYPLAWWSLVQEAAATYSIDPFLVLAVMREESNFSPTAVSSSGARGLMQLLPSTAKWILESKLNQPFHEDDLDDPEVNISLGTWYLRHLLEQVDFDLAKAAAAYNGGPGNLQRWIAASPVTHPVDLPAVLASSETREYLTKVLNSWLAYRWLYPPRS